MSALLMMLTSMLLLCCNWCACRRYFIQLLLQLLPCGFGMYVYTRTICTGTVDFVVAVNDFYTIVFVSVVVASFVAMPGLTQISK